jgi:hypothetical protein
MSVSQISALSADSPHNATTSSEPFEAVMAQTAIQPSPSPATPTDHGTKEQCDQLEQGIRDHARDRTIAGTTSFTAGIITLLGGSLPAGLITLAGAGLAIQNHFQISDLKEIQQRRCSSPSQPAQPAPR